MSVGKTSKINTPAMVSLHYLVMLHVCEKLLPAVELPQELLSATVRESLSAFSHDESREPDLSVITNFMTTITGVDGIDYAEISVGEFISSLQKWWGEYKATEQPAPHVQHDIVKLIATLAPKKDKFSGYQEAGRIDFNRFIKVISGEAFSDIAYRVKDNPFVGFTRNTDIRKDFYSITANIEFITDTEALPPGYPSPYVDRLPMISISGNPARVGSSLKLAVVHVANYLLDVNLGAEGFVAQLTICKNNKEFIKIPVSINANDPRVFAEDIDEYRLLLANKHPEEIYSIDFKKMKVVTSDPVFVGKLCEGLHENEQYYFKAGHFQDELGV